MASIPKILGVRGEVQHAGAPNSAAPTRLILRQQDEHSPAASPDFPVSGMALTPPGESRWHWAKDVQFLTDLLRRHRTASAVPLRK